jgi:hypothetical protein
MNLPRRGARVISSVLVAGAFAALGLATSAGAAGVALGNAAAPATAAGVRLAAPRAEPNLPFLLSMHSHLTEMRYTPGALDRAAHFQARLEAIAAELQRIAKQPLPFVGWVLAREEWRDAGLPAPFGVPRLVGKTGIAVPAWGDDELVATWTGLVGAGLPSSEEQPLRGTAQEMSALALADILAQLELGQVFVEQTGLRADQPWVAAVAAHLAARIVFERAEPRRWPEIDAALLVPLVARAGGDGARPIGGYSPALPLAEWLWYEAQFARGADLVFAKEGARGSRKLLARMIKSGADGGELLGRVEQLAAWRARAFAR